MVPVAAEFRDEREPASLLVAPGEAPRSEPMGDWPLPLKEARSTVGLVAEPGGGARCGSSCQELAVFGLAIVFEMLAGREMAWRIVFFFVGFGCASGNEYKG